MIKSAMHAIATGPKFRGKTKALRLLHRLVGRSVVRSRYGPLIYNEPGDDTNFYYISGSDENNYTDVYREVMMIPPGACFLDIGANAGLFSLVTSPLVGLRGRVIAFEPNVSVFNALVKNIKINGCSNILPMNMAIGAETGVARFRSGEGNHSGIGYLSDAGDMSVWQATFSDLLPLLEKIIEERATYVKIDVEGAECIVIESMRNFLTRSQVETIIVEINDRHLVRFGGSSKKLYEAAEGLGFTGRRGLMPGEHYNEVFLR